MSGCATLTTTATPLKVVSATKTQRLHFHMSSLAQIPKLKISRGCSLAQPPSAAEGW